MGLAAGSCRSRGNCRCGRSWGQQVIGKTGVVNFPTEEGVLGCAGPPPSQQARQGSVDHLADGRVGAEEGVSFGDEGACVGNARRLELLRTTKGQVERVRGRRLCIVKALAAKLSLAEVVTSVVTHAC